MATSDPVMQELTRTIEQAISTGGGERRVTSSVATALTSALSAGLTLAEPVTKPHTDHYVMYPLHIADNGSFCIASAVWNVGQHTPVHDHGVWGVVGIYSGAEREIRYANDSPGPLHRLAETHWARGDVTICCTTDQDLHEVSCASPEPCVGIHIYGGDIGRIRRRAYDPRTGNVDYFVSTWAQPA